jgi:hypothetical protein
MEPRVAVQERVLPHPLLKKKKNILFHFLFLFLLPY